MRKRALKVEASGLSDCGIRRSHNEDALSVQPDLGLFLVADGMGGHNAGEVASITAIESVVEYLRSPELAPEDVESTDPALGSPDQSETARRLVRAIQFANREVHQASLENEECRDMGSTLVAALLDPVADEIHIAHVGDSRCYLLRHGHLDRLTNDHSMVEELVRMGLLSRQGAVGHPQASIITRAVGNRPYVQVDVQTLRIEEGDVLLLCSDGLSNMVSDAQIERTLIACHDLDTAAQSLVSAANDSGGKDNITAVLARFSYAMDDTEHEPSDDQLCLAGVC